MKKLIITFLLILGVGSTTAQSQTDKVTALEKAKELCSTWSQAAGMIMTYRQAGYSASDNFKNFKNVVDSVAAGQDNTETYRIGLNIVEDVYELPLMESGVAKLEASGIYKGKFYEICLNDQKKNM